MNVDLRLMEATVECVWWGGVYTVIFIPNPTTVLWLVLCCRWGCDNEDLSVLNFFIVSFCFWLIVAPFFSLLRRRGEGLDRRGLKIYSMMGSKITVQGKKIRFLVVYLYSSAGSSDEEAYDEY